MAGPGRPRDPDLTGRIVDTATAVIAANGMAGFNADTITIEARAGKAAIYRRWHTMPDLLVDVVAKLGVRPEDLQLVDDLAAVGLRDDLWCLFAAAGSGPRAVTEVAVLPLVGRDPALRNAHTRGPLVRLMWACDHIVARERMRGGRLDTQATNVMHAGVALLQQRMATTGRQVHSAWIDDALDYLVLPALGREPVRS